MVLQEIDKPRLRQRKPRNILDQRCSDGIGGRLACALTVDDVAPPLKTDLAGHWLARTLTHAGDLDIERIKPEQRSALVGGGKERRQKPVFISRADQCLAMTIIFVHRRNVAKRCAQSTAIRAAPTLRRSPNRMLYVRTAAPVGVTSSPIRASRNRQRSFSGMNHGCLPVPSINNSTSEPKTLASDSSVISSGLVTGHAQMPAGRHRIDPRCDMSAKRKPPLP